MLQLTKYLKTIKNPKTTLTFSDKSSNLYKVPKEQLKKLVNSAITASYEMVSKKTQDQFNSQGKNRLKYKEVVTIMFVNDKQNCFITLKDHKRNFQNKPTLRLLNLAKNELGRVSKTILEKINVNLRNSLYFNQWKSTQEVINWLKSIDYKQRDFYPSISPSISEELLTDTLTFPETIIKLDDHDKQIMYHSRKSLLFVNRYVDQKRR